MGAEAGSCSSEGLYTLVLFLHVCTLILIYNYSYKVQAQYSVATNDLCHYLPVDLELLLHSAMILCCPQPQTGLVGPR